MPLHRSSRLLRLCFERGHRCMRILRIQRMQSTASVLLPKNGMPVGRKSTRDDSGPVQCRSHLQMNVCLGCSSAQLLDFAGRCCGRGHCSLQMLVGRMQFSLQSALFCSSVLLVHKRWP